MSTQGTDQGHSFGGVIDVLEAVGAEYAIWGGMATIAYGEPRFTQDMDILLRGASLAIRPFQNRLIESHYYVDEPTMIAATSSGGFFNVIHQHYAVKIDFYVPVEPYLLKLIDDRVYLPFDQMRRAAYVTAAGVVAAKLRAYVDSASTRHLDDIAGIIRVQGRRIDPAPLDRLAAELGCFGVWRALWAENSSIR